MLQPRVQVGQTHLVQEPTEAQARDATTGHKVRASVTEQAEWDPFCAMPENGEKVGQVVERQPTISQSPASVSVKLFLLISFRSDRVEEVRRGMHRGKMEGYRNNALHKKGKIRKLF